MNRIARQLFYTSGLHSNTPLTYPTSAGWYRALTAQAAAKSQTALIKELRELTGAPITDVKSSLIASGWDIQRAHDALRVKGLAAAAKRSSRIAAEGLVGVAERPGAAAVVEVNCETDFVARSEIFQGLVGLAARSALDLVVRPPGLSNAGAPSMLDVQMLMASQTVNGRSITDTCAEVGLQVRENVTVRRAFRVETSTGVLSTYIHKGEGLQGLGRIATVVVLEAADGQPLLATTSNGTDTLQEAAHALAMHAAGLRPRYISRSDVPAEALQREREVLRQQASTSGKPAAVISKIVDGRLARFYEEHCLLDQHYLLDESMTVKQVLQRWSPNGRIISVAALLRVQVGEGLEATPKQNFVEEVSQLMRQC